MSASSSAKGTVLRGDDERAFAESVRALSRTNPFTPERRALERRALGNDFVDVRGPWGAGFDRRANNPNVDRIEERAIRLADVLLARRGEGALSDEEAPLYLALQRFALYATHSEPLARIFDETDATKRKRSVPALFHVYAADARRRLSGPGLPPLGDDALATQFAVFSQLRRAFHHIFSQILGGSSSTGVLRARIWESIFTHDMERYERALVGRMGELATLVLGPSGSGKELIARAIARSSYVPFDARAGLFVDDEEPLAVLHLAALPPTLIESALFGHVKGAFTGAIADRRGAFERSAAHGTVLLDEIGELTGELQVKLLRLLEARTFQRVGEDVDRTFRGKVIAATHRDLGQAIVDGRFREDLFYRLCADVIESPSLDTRIREDESELPLLVRFLASRLVGEHEAELLAEDVLAFIARALPRHRWPGNVRELDQCVRNVLVTGRYVPLVAAQNRTGGDDSFVDAVRAGSLSLDELADGYAARAYERAGSYEEAARHLLVDRRTVKKHVDSAATRRVRNANST
jgi:transcriptional regulator with AAA-type ATPase domain